MEQQKLKLNKVWITVSIILIVLIGVLIIQNINKYNYNTQLDKILNIENVKVKNKRFADSWAIGEWYICEIYDINNLNDFISGNKKNYLYYSDNNWYRKDWDHLPVDSSYNGIIEKVFNYQSTKKISNIIKEMENILLSERGYYSFLCQPLGDEAQKIIFFLLHMDSNRLYIIDLYFQIARILSARI